jgi:AraC-like DNA-binding protein
MHLTFTSSTSAENKLLLPHPADFSVASHYKERKSELIESWGKFNIKELWFEGVCVIETEAVLTEACTVTVSCNSFYCLMNFVLNGDLWLKLKDDELKHISEGSYYTNYTTALNAAVILKRSARVLTICLNQKFINKLIGENPVKLTLNDRERLAGTGNFRHTRQQAILKEITEAKHPGVVRRIFLESKILELLSIQLQQAETIAATKGFSKDDVARLQEAKQLITLNLQTPYSLMELARKTGLNDFKLKKGFKALFGHTVFGYLYELRMDNAYRLLQDGKSVSEVAETIGYKNPHHFTAAFKKKFGFLPSQVAKMAV